MKIAYVCADFGIPVRGDKGASVHVREMVAALVGRGHEVRVVTPNSVGENAIDGSVHIIAPPRWPSWSDRLVRSAVGGHERGPVEVRELAYNTFLYKHAGSLFRSWRPDVVYERYSLLSLSGLALARRFAIPHVLEVNAPLPLERARTVGLVFGVAARAVERAIFSQSDVILTVSRALQEYVVERGAPRANTQVVPNGVDVNRFGGEAGRDEMRRQLGIPREDFVVGFAGSLKPWHGVEILLDAYAVLRQRVPAVRLLIVGAGPQGDALRERAVRLELGDGVIFTGRVAHASMPHVLAAMDVGAAPYLSVPDFYFSPLKIYEYMAAGLPVVASDAGEIPALVHEGKTGFICPPGDAERLARRLANLAGAPQLRQVMGRSARAVAETHTWDANARIVEDVTLAARAGNPMRSAENLWV